MTLKYLVNEKGSPANHDSLNLLQLKSKEEDGNQLNGSLWVQVMAYGQLEGNDVSKNSIKVDAHIRVWKSLAPLLAIALILN